MLQREREGLLIETDRQWSYYGVILGIKICLILVLWSRRDKRLLRENIEAESKNRSIQTAETFVRVMPCAMVLQVLGLRTRLLIAWWHWRISQLVIFDRNLGDS